MKFRDIFKRPPIVLYGSRERESGYAQETVRLYKEYRKTHPNEPLTQELVNQLWRDKRASEK
jgi:hypothetical protein